MILRPGPTSAAAGNVMTRGSHPSHVSRRRCCRQRHGFRPLGYPARGGAVQRRYPDHEHARAGGAGAGAERGARARHGDQRADARPGGTGHAPCRSRRQARDARLQRCALAPLRWRCRAADARWHWRWTPSTPSRTPFMPRPPPRRPANGSSGFCTTTPRRRGHWSGPISTPPLRITRWWCSTAAATPRS